ncbi:hypothetical protein D3C80_1932850 [compost metagenome]
MAILRNVGYTTLGYGSRRLVGNIPATCFNRSRIYFPQACYRLNQLSLAIAIYPGNSYDFSSLYFKIKTI